MSVQQTKGISDAGGQFCLSTGLQFLRDPGESGDENGGVLNVDDVTCVDFVSSLVDNRVTSSLKWLQIQKDHCILLKFGPHHKNIVLVANSKEACEQWYKVFAELVGRPADNAEKVSLKMVLEMAADDDKDNFGIEDCIKIVKKSRRKVDENYMYHIIQSLLPQEKSNQGAVILEKLQLTSLKGVSDKSKKRAFNASLNLDQFMEFFRQIVITGEVENVFKKLTNKQNADENKCLTPSQFWNFLNNIQKDEMAKEDVQKWISENEPALSFYNLSCSAFSNYFFAENNSVINSKHNSVYQDMNQPLSHYFIATSHNTYLTANQLKGKSSVDAYISAFKRGCKCVELDCWDGPNMEPVIYHGHTLTSKILFKDIIQAIKDYGFLISPYPVILSIENHCSVEQQKVMAQHLKTILGDLLYLKPIPEEECMLPSPSDLSGRVIVKGKKLKPNMPLDQESATEVNDDDDIDFDDEFSDDDLTEDSLEDLVTRKSATETPADLMSLGFLDMEDDEEEGEEEIEVTTAGDSQVRRKSSLLRNAMGSFKKRMKNEEKVKIPKLAEELSDLVIYCQATGFKGFEHSRSNAKHFEMSSFAEKKAVKFSRDEYIPFVQYNQRQLSRIYPAGARIDSSNYNPVPLWNVGCQLVALNYQTPCREMHLNQGLFQDNGFCGYVLKPEFLRQKDVTFNPQGPFSSFETISIRIISGHQLPYKQEWKLHSERNYQVYVQFEGVEADVQCQKTDPVKNNGFYPRWNEVLVFKVHVPELTLVKFAVCTKTLIAQQTVRYHSLKQGFRCVPLTDKHSELLPNSYLFIHLEMSS